jgi:hypothetical protein
MKKGQKQKSSRWDEAPTKSELGLGTQPARQIVDNGDFEGYHQLSNRRAFAECGNPDPNHIRVGWHPRTPR